MQEVVKECARIYADLASLEISYNHGHCMDEFRSDFKGNRRVIDFGTAKLFDDESILDKKELSRLEQQLELQLRTTSVLVDRTSSLYDAAFSRLQHLQVEVASREKKIRLAKDFSGGTLPEYFKLGSLKINDALLQIPVSTFVNLVEVVDDAYVALETFFARRHFCMKAENKSGAEVFEPHRVMFTQTLFEHYLKNRK